MSALRRWYQVLKKYIGRLKPSQPAGRVVWALEDLDGEAEPADRSGGCHAPLEVSRRSAVDKMNYHPKSRPVGNGYAALDAQKAVSRITNQDIDSTGFDSLETYADGLSISQETIVKWINAGILSPRETELAEKIIRIMRERDRRSGLSSVRRS